MKPVNSLPATVTTVLGTAAALIIASGRLTATQAALLTSLAVSIGTVVIVTAGALAGKPVSMQAVTGAATIIAADLALFGIRMNADQRGALVAAVGVIAGIIFHLLHVTVDTVTAPALPVTADPAMTQRLTEGP